jgi:cyclopropane fatty-acyl-phospholipid synthase-like methyltransferase
MTFRLSSAAAERNKNPILEVLQRVLPASGIVLEIASGGGQHVVHFAKGLPALTWQPSDPNADARASIAAWIAAEHLENVRPPLALDASAASWRLGACDAIVCINMIHIAPWTAAEGLFAGAERLLPAGGVLYLYGPYRMHGRQTAPSNETFDASLRAQDPQWGVRNLDDVQALAARHGFVLTETVDMPANNFSVIFRRVREGRAQVKS